MPVNYASWSIKTIPSSGSAANARCCTCQCPRSTTARQRCGSRRCASWPGSILSSWRIPAAAAAGWWAIWPEMESRSAVTGCETSCTAWGLGRSTKKMRIMVQVLPSSIFPAWWSQYGHGCGSGLGDRYCLHPTPEGVPLTDGARGSLLQERAQLKALKYP